jgi:hypothetical protein
MSRTDSLSPSIPEPSPPRPRLNWLGQILVALVLIIGIGASIYAGMMLGLIVGLNRAGPKFNEPRPGVGLAPDLSGLFEGAADIVVGFVVGILGGLVVGLILAWLVYRFALKRLALSIPGLTRTIS